jgi:hypothetical protein
MTTIKNERGIALVLVLILALIGLAIVSSLIYMMTTGTRSSGAEKFYRTADEAALGGAMIGVNLITTNFDNAAAGGALSAPLPALGTQVGDNVDGGSSNACLTQKLSLPPTDWASCVPSNVNMDPGDTPDMTFTLQGIPDPITGVQINYNVDTKIVDTVQGNTAGATSGKTWNTSGPGSGSNTVVTPPRRSWLYRIEVQAEDAVNPRERARYSVLYAH